MQQHLEGKKIGDLMTGSQSRKQSPMRRSCIDAPNRKITKAVPMNAGHGGSQKSFSGDGSSGAAEHKEEKRWARSALKSRKFVECLRRLWGPGCTPFWTVRPRAWMAERSSSSENSIKEVAGDRGKTESAES